MNPWISIWIRPRQTIRQIVDTDPKRMVIPLTVAAGVTDALMQAMGNLHYVLGVAILFSLVVGPVLGILGLYFVGWLFRWGGRWFGGQATSVEVRAAVAWTKIPSLVLFGLWVVLLFVGAPQGVLVFKMSGMVILVWQLVLLCKTVAEVHRFSDWKGTGAVVIPFLLLVLPLLIAIAVPNLLRARHMAEQRPAVTLQGGAALPVDSAGK